MSNWASAMPSARSFAFPAQNEPKVDTVNDFQATGWCLSACVRLAVCT